VRPCGPAFNRFASRAEAAIVTARQCRLVDPGWLSINSNSSSQSTAESWACSGPSNSFTALMNAENSRSAICICSLQIELEKDSFVSIGSSSVSAIPGTRSWFTPQGHQVSDDSDGVHKCDHTRGVDRKQLDDGIDHTFVSAGGSETICPSFLFKLCPPGSLLCRCRSSTAEPIPKYNRHAPTGWRTLAGWFVFLWELAREITAEALGLGLL
jgi:hypothetical protein